MPPAANRCRPLFESAFAQSVNVEEFYRGLLVGYCEKLVLHACEACMVRPEEPHRGVVTSLLFELRDVYPIRHRAIDDEYWFGLADRIDVSVRTWRDLPVCSPAWHTARGLAVGIPSHMIDTEYHRR